MSDRKLNVSNGIEKGPSLEELYEIDGCINEVLRVNQDTLVSIREHTEGLKPEEIAEAFASNFKFKVADLLNQHWAAKKGEEKKLDAAIVARLKERAGEFV